MKKFRLKLPLLAFSMALLGFSTSLAQDLAFQEPNSQGSALRSSGDPVSDLCLKCMCQTRNAACDPVKTTCSDDLCGAYIITRPYWIDAGKPTLNGTPAADDVSAFKSCMSSNECAERAIQAYVKRFEKDCNADSAVNCLDHFAIHLNGGWGCTNPIPEKFKTSMDNCLAQGGGSNDLDLDIDVRFGK